MQSFFFAFFEIIFFGVFFGQVWRNLGKNPSHPVAVLRGGGWAMTLPDFWLASYMAPQFFA